MIVPIEEHKLEDMTLKPKEKDTPQSAICMVPTLTDYTNLQKLKIEGFLEQQPVIVLIDTTSTHNFMSSNVPTRLMLQKEDYSGFEVKVAKGQILNKGKQVILRGKRGNKATMIITQHLEKVPKEESSDFSIQIQEFQEMKLKEIEDKNPLP
ncbi:hypothetical protein BHE74_00019567 [Ensete ventricosum]|nr:hypothetical protein BHE74_00019567 [Ensete ventricosum]